MWPAALLGGAGLVWAFDMDPRRLARLEANAAAAGAGNVVASQADFLKVDVAEERFAQVQTAVATPMTGTLMALPCIGPR